MMKIKANIKKKADLNFSSVHNLSYMKLVFCIKSSQLNCTLFILNQSLVYITIGKSFLSFNMEKRKLAVKYLVKTKNGRKFKIFILKLNIIIVGCDFRFSKGIDERGS